MLTAFILYLLECVLAQTGFLFVSFATLLYPDTALPSASNHNNAFGRTNAFVTVLNGATHCLFTARRDVSRVHSTTLRRLTGLCVPNPPLSLS